MDKNGGNSVGVSGVSSSIASSSYVRSYFILDVYTGTIHTSKLIDLENFCDVNACKNRPFSKLSNSSSNEPDCFIELKVKATRHVYSTNTSNSTTVMTPSMSSVYHISFGLIIHDINEFKPEFLTPNGRQPIWFNVSEEFAPIRLAVGSVAYDNDCDDRGRVSYDIRVVNVNDRAFTDWLAESRQFLSSKSSPYSEFIRRNNRSSNIFEFQVKK